jgi:hypothetical protein
MTDELEKPMGYALIDPETKICIRVAYARPSFFAANPERYLGQWVVFDPEAELVYPQAPAGAGMLYVEEENRFDFPPYELPTNPEIESER